MPGWGSRGKGGGSKASGSARAARYARMSGGTVPAAERAQLEATRDLAAARLRGMRAEGRKPRSPGSTKPLPSGRPVDPMRTATTPIGARGRKAVGLNRLNTQISRAEATRDSFARGTSDFNRAARNVLTLRRQRLKEHGVL